MIEPSELERVDELSRRTGRTRSDTLREVLSVGLDTIERENLPTRKVGSQLPATVKRGGTEGRAMVTTMLPPAECSVVVALCQANGQSHSAIMRRLVELGLGAAEGVDCPEQRVAELLSEADAFVMPSHFEAYGIVFAEALSRGVPCVGRDVCEMPHFISGGANGALVRTDDSGELAQAMVRCVRDPRIREGAWGGAEVARREYSWDAVAGRIAEIVGNDRRALGIVTEEETSRR